MLEALIGRDDDLGYEGVLGAVRDYLRVQDSERGGLT
jgi:hypothetical protein